MTQRRVGVWVLAVALSVAGCLAGWHLGWAWWLDTQLSPVRRLMDEDRFSEARIKLVGIARWWPRHPEVAYRLGVCEHAAGNVPGALALWSRVGRNAPPWTVQAGLARARTLAGDYGRFTDVEATLEALLDDQKNAEPKVRDEIRHTLSELLFWEGRRAPMKRLIEAGWRWASDPIEELRDHWRVDNAVLLIDVIRPEIERAARLAPDDDRVWLAQVNLAIKSGQFAEAARLLDRCTERRPDDQSVWLARLDLARARDDIEGARQAFARLPADLFAPAERLSMQAWIASHRGDHDTERKALEEVVRLAPGDSRLLDRLASMAWDSGAHDQATQYRRRKAEIDTAKDRYRDLIAGKVAQAQFAEMGRLADTLGRRFEALGWCTLRNFFAPEDRAARTALNRLKKQPEPEPLGPGVMLASVLPAVEAPVKSAVTTTAPAPELAGLAVPRFFDRAETAGLSFTFENGRTAKRQIPETSGGGFGLIDYDGDGRMDLYVLQGGDFPPDPSRPNSGDRLYRNRGDGTFDDVTVSSGIARMRRGYGHGVAVADVDNDGHPDLFITRWRQYNLLRNRGDGTFEDVTERWGLGGDRDWPTSAAFADLDNDGDLDLYVCHYLVWDEVHPVLCDRVTMSSKAVLSEPNQRYNYCSPRSFGARPDHLFRNDGGRFTDVTAAAGIVDTHGRSFGVIAVDVDGDHLVDLFVSNDTTANYLWHNLGGMKFEEAALTSGVACNADGAFQAGMGVACGDMDNDGQPDLFVTNFYGESITYFHNLGGGMFSDQTADSGLAAPSRYLLEFGIGLLDANNDGYLDLATANGHVNDDRPDYPYEMPGLIMIGDASGKLHDVTAAAGACWSVLRVGRGMIAGDLDNDGRVDALMLSQKSPLTYFHNETPAGMGHYVSFRLEGTRSNRDAIGAVVTIKAGGQQRRAWRYGGGGFQSSSDPRVHFGLGSATRVDSVEVLWPSGQVDRIGPLEADRHYRLREGSATPIALDGPGAGKFARNGLKP